MSFTISPNYFGGDFNKGIFLPAIAKQTDLQASLFRIANGKFRVIVPKMARQNRVQVGSTCTVTPTNTQSMGEVRLDLVQLTIREEVCKDSLINSNYAMEQARGVYNDEVVQEVLTALLQDGLEGMNAEAARLRWVGSVTGGDAMDGVIATAQAVGVPTVVATTITAANVIAEIQKVLDALPASVRFSNPNLRLVISPSVLSAYQAAVAQQVGLATWGVGATTDTNAENLSFAGYFGGSRVPMYVVVQLESLGDVMLAGSMSDSTAGNLVLGTDALLDFGGIILHDRQTVNPLDTKIEFGMSVRQAVAILEPTDMVLYI